MQKLRPYLQLLRLPAVFTAMADIFLGYLLNFQHELYPLKVEFGLLLLASSGLYLAGMVLNDYFDRHIDVQERPERPIPSGRVPAKSALVLGLILLAVGVGAAAVVGKQSLLIAGILAGCVLAYDAVLKRTPLGPVVMGGCRFFNVMLGASAAEPVWHMPQLHVAAGLGIYIIGVTWFARTEAQQSSRAQLAAAMGTVNLGLAVLAALVRNWSGEAEPALIYCVLAVIFLTINRRLVSAVMDPTPAKVQPAIKLMLMSLVMLDATLVYFQRAVAWEAAVVAGLLIPATLLARWIRVT